MTKLKNPTLAQRQNRANPKDEEGEDGEEFFIARVPLADLPAFIKGESLKGDSLY